MIFEENRGRKGQFSGVFNQMAGRPLDETAFFQAAREAGYLEARTFAPGETLLFENSRMSDRITVRTYEDGRVKGFEFG